MTRRGHEEARWFEVGGLSIDPRVSDTLREVFGFEGARPGQERAIAAALAGRDVLVILPTGGGKSLCYQVPAVIRARAGAGLTVVVSPLIALMEDQVAALERRGVAAACVHSGRPYAEQRATLARLDTLSLLYASPERLANASFRKRLGAARPALLAIDEAHCISEWGHDFRPEYRQLNVLKEALGCPVMALTATATPRVAADIVAAVGMRAPVSVLGAFERPNLSFSVRLIPGDRDRAAFCAALLAPWRPARRGRPAPAEVGRALVYVATKKRAAAVCKALRAAKLPAAYYHGGRTDLARARAHAGFVSGKTPILVATSAFGMGVDLPDVRVVIHAQAPGSLEAYYQQAGRAGRDGDAAECWLLYSAADAVVQARLRGKDPTPGSVEGWRAMAAYALAGECRQARIVAHFSALGGGADRCGRCDVCRDPAAVVAANEVFWAAHTARKVAREDRARRDEAVVLDAAQRELVVAFVEGLRKPLGRRLVAAGLKGSLSKVAKRKRLDQNGHFGALRGVPEAAIVAAIDALLEAGRLAPKGRKYPTLWIPNKRVRPARVAAKAKQPRGLEQTLKAFRKRAARAGKLKAYQVFPNRTLKDIVTRRPRTPAELGAVWGMGGKRAARYGEAILELVRGADPGGRGAAMRAGELSLGGHEPSVGDNT